MSAKTLKLSDVTVGDTLPDLPIPLTTSLIVGGAVASRDFTPVHHDKSAAQAAGMQDVFMNILTTNGLVGRFVSDWAGPNALIRQVKIRLGTPNLPGDTMTLSGSVTSVEGDLVEVEVAGKNSWGNHVTGTVRVELLR
jgi:acyl dehydratase